MEIGQQVHCIKTIPQGHRIGQTGTILILLGLKKDRAMVQCDQQRRKSDGEKKVFAVDRHQFKSCFRVVSMNEYRVNFFEVLETGLGKLLCAAVVAAPTDREAVIKGCPLIQGFCPGQVAAQVVLL